jgi:hypothetical protein
MIDTVLMKDGLEYKLVVVEPYSGGAMFREDGYNFHFLAEFEEKGYGVQRFLGIQVVCKSSRPAPDIFNDPQSQSRAFEKVREAFRAEFDNVDGLMKISEGQYRIETSLIG